MLFRISTAACLACSPLSLVGPTHEGHPALQGQSGIQALQDHRGFQEPVEPQGLQARRELPAQLDPPEQQERPAPAAAAQPASFTRPPFQS